MTEIVWIWILLYLVMGSLVAFAILKLGDAKEYITVTDKIDYLWVGTLFLALALSWPVFAVAILTVWLIMRIGKEVMKFL